MKIGIFWKIESFIRFKIPIISTGKMEENKW